jgi:hypothetical protein
MEVVDMADGGLQTTRRGENPAVNLTGTGVSQASKCALRTIRTSGRCSSPGEALQAMDPSPGGWS